MENFFSQTLVGHMAGWGVSVVCSGQCVATGLEDHHGLLVCFPGIQVLLNFLCVNWIYVIRFVQDYHNIVNEN